MGAFRLCLIDVMENRIISKAKQRLRIPYHPSASQCCAWHRFMGATSEKPQTLGAQKGI